MVSITCAEYNCPTWLHPSGAYVGVRLGLCNETTQEGGVLRTYCLTSNGVASNTRVVTM